MRSWVAGWDWWIRVVGGEESKVLEQTRVCFVEIWEKTPKRVCVWWQDSTNAYVFATLSAPNANVCGMCAECVWDVCGMCSVYHVELQTRMHLFLNYKRTCACQKKRRNLANAHVFGRPITNAFVFGPLCIHVYKLLFNLPLQLLTCCAALDPKLLLPNFWGNECWRLDFGNPGWGGDEWAHPSFTCKIHERIPCQTNPCLLPNTSICALNHKRRKNTGLYTMLFLKNRKKKILT
jgi:hypothetical protein